MRDQRLRSFSSSHITVALLLVLVQLNPVLSVEVAEHIFTVRISVSHFSHGSHVFLCVVFSFRIR